YRDTEIQRYRDTEIQRYRDTEIQRYRDTEIQSYRDTEYARVNSATAPSQCALLRVACCLWHVASIAFALSSAHCTAHTNPTPICSTRSAAM
ncbi:hypothetical protein B484DRAFT_266858, partial [Ochromonadaceae sp. CCMP2298]